MMSEKEESLRQLEFSDEHIIERWKDAANPDYYYYITDAYTSPAWLWYRELAHKRGLDNHPEIVKTDIEVLKLVLKKKGAERPFIKKPPLEFWWYYLHLIQDGKYPMELLPEHLQNIYKEHLEKLTKKRNEG